MNQLTKIIALFILCLPYSALAAMAVVEVDTGAENINAIEATVILPDGMSISDIQTGNSVILMWLHGPEQAGDTITFAGITPGGFSGKHSLFKIIGELTSGDIGEVRFGDVRALRSDGSGTATTVKLSIASDGAIYDEEPPDDFSPVIATDPDLFEGKYFLVFATQDKGFGVERYEVREGKWGKFTEAESPHLLKYQKLNRDVYVKAVDYADNERIVVLDASMHKSWWERYGLSAIIVMLALVLFVTKRLWTKSAR